MLWYYHHNNKERHNKILRKRHVSNDKKVDITIEIVHSASPTESFDVKSK